MNTELSVEELLDPLQTVIGVVEKKTNVTNSISCFNSTKRKETNSYYNRYGIGNKRFK